MKLTVIGGGGVRSPLLVSSTLKRAQRLHLDELCLMDIDAEKLAVSGVLAGEVARQLGSPVRITTTTDPNAALDSAAHVITTIRVGNDPARILDERIALQHGVLGQETTGPGGFAMAMRSIPAILKYAELLEKRSPGAWIFNFTNPAGLVTQALRQQGFHRTVGICDSANAAQHTLAAWLNLDPGELRAEVFGLNHLSWARKVWHAGEDLLHPLLHDPAFQAGSMLHLFEPGLIAAFDMFLNEYLFYYYYREEALRQVLAQPHTRGEKVAEMNRAMLEELGRLIPISPAQALEAFYRANQQRGLSYMPYTPPGYSPAGYTPPGAAPSSAPVRLRAERTRDQAEEGYAGVALNIMEALQTGEPLYTALNIPNFGAIEGMEDEDVVEISCRVDRSGVAALMIGAIPAPQLGLMRSVKLYERLAVEAILTRSRLTAVMALMNHPLVLSYSLAQMLVDEYLAAHRQWVGEWK